MVKKVFFICVMTGALMGCGEVDRCLDAGGRYDDVTKTCEM